MVPNVARAAVFLLKWDILAENGNACRRSRRLSAQLQGQGAVFRPYLLFLLLRLRLTLLFNFAGKLSCSSSRTLHIDLLRCFCLERLIGFCSIVVFAKQSTRKARSALSLVCSRNAPSEPTSASSCHPVLGACQRMLSIARPASQNGHILAEAAKFHLCIVSPLRLRHDLFPKIGLLAIQQSVLQALHAQAWLAPRSIIRVCSRITIKQYIFQGYISFGLGVFQECLIGVCSFVVN